MLQVGDRIPYVPPPKLSPIETLGPCRWHIVTTMPNSERSTVDRLAGELQVETYLPIKHDTVRAGRGRVRPVERAMFTSYLFVRLPYDREAWRRVLGVRGVEDFLSFPGGHPKCLTDAAVLAVRWHEGVENGRWLQRQVQKQESPFELGQQVWADVLPFKRMLGQVTGFDARGYVQVLLDMEVFGRKEWPMEPRLLHEVLD